MRIRTAVAAASVAALLAVGCGGSPRASGPRAGSASAAATDPSGESAPSTSAASGGRTDPTTIDPDTDFGQTILITRAGFRPAWLLALPAEDVTWENQTGRTWTVAFDHQQVTSGPIPPGGTWRWSSATPLSVTYHAVQEPRMTGRLQLQTV